MTDQQHPITPPPELVEQWRTAPECTTGLQKLMMVSMTTDRLQEIATQAARWGSDQELEACLTDVSFYSIRAIANKIRAARRPKPPSLKEQALEAMSRFDGEMWCSEMEADLAVIRTALEQLDD